MRLPLPIEAYRWSNKSGTCQFCFTKKPITKHGYISSHKLGGDGVTCKGSKRAPLEASGNALHVERQCLESDLQANFYSPEVRERKAQELVDINQKIEDRKKAVKEAETYRVKMAVLNALAIIEDAEKELQSCTSIGEDDVPFLDQLRNAVDWDALRKAKK